MQIVSSTGQTTLTAAIASTGATSLSVASGVNLAAGVVIQIDSELMQITVVSGLNLTVTRGFNSTAAATHSNAATVTIMAGIAVGTLLDSTTAAAKTSFAVAFNQIRIDGTVVSGGGATALTTDSWGSGMLFMSLSAGSHRVEVQTASTLPWCEPAFYVGPLGALAIKSAGLALAVPGNVTSYDSTHVVTNLAWASFNTPTMIGQILTFTSGALNGQSFNVSSYSASGGTWLKLGFTPAWAGANPAAGDAFVISNVATAASLAAGMNTLPNATAQLIIDQTGANGSDASPLQTIQGTPFYNPAAVVAALVASGVLQYVSGSSGPLQLTQTAMAQVPIPAAVNIQTTESIDESC